MLTDAEIRERDGFKCARCASSADLHIHHRMPRSGGSDESAANRVTLCASCHRWCHAHPEQAGAQGWVVLRSADPALVPVQHAVWPAGPILLREDGSVEIWQPDTP